MVYGYVIKIMAFFFSNIASYSFCRRSKLRRKLKHNNQIQIKYNINKE